MKAVRIHHYGDRDALRYEDIEVPAPAESELLVRVKATSVNPVDVSIRQGKLQPLFRHELPLVLGWDLSGVIEAVGKGVSKFTAGDAVFAGMSIHRQGAYAEYALVPEAEAAFKPQTLDHNRAAAVPIAGLTAWQGLFEAGRLSDNQTVLVHGAAGSIGHLAVQFAKCAGARVLATASIADHEFVAQLGAEVLIDANQKGFERTVPKVDLVLDTLGGTDQDCLFDLVKPGGRIISAVREPSQRIAKSANVYSQLIVPRPDGTLLARICKMLDRGQIAPAVAAALPLAEAVAAHERLESEHVRGKIVLKTI